MERFLKAGPHSRGGAPLVSPLPRGQQILALVVPCPLCASQPQREQTGKLHTVRRQPDVYRNGNEATIQTHQETMP